MEERRKEESLETEYKSKSGWMFTMSGSKGLYVQGGPDRYFPEEFTESKGDGNQKNLKKKNQKPKGTA